MIQITLKNSSGEAVVRAAHESDAMLLIGRGWEAGDTVELSAPEEAHLMVRMGAFFPESEVYLPKGKMTWRVPEGEHRLAYAPGIFDGPRQIVTARLMMGPELSLRRDLARNPADLRGDTDFFPHCTANVETRGESVFAARNVIDGLRFNTSHGKWPFESWGIGAREDAWCLVDFGREIVAEQMALTLRADFPHDAYWVSGHAAASDGSEFSFSLNKTGERQWIDLGGRKIRWIRLEGMRKSDDPSAFPSLRAWEVYGRECE